MTLSTTAWIALAAFVHFIWGLHPVALRYLQIKSPHALTSLQLSFLVSLSACPAILLQALWERCALTRGSQRVASTEDEENSLLVDLLALGDAGPAPPRPPRPVAGTGCKKLGFLAATTLALCTLQLSQIFALVFVEAFIAQLMFLTAPLIVSLLDMAFLRTPLPRSFWPTLLLMLVGAGMVVGGKAIALPAGPPAADAILVAALPWRVLVGVGLSLLSAVALAVFMLVLQVAGGAIGDVEVLGCSFPTQALLSLASTWALERGSFPILGQLRAQEWAIVVGMAVGLSWGANLLQQITIRRLGAPQVAAFSPLHLVGALFMSDLILGEELDNAWEGAGSALVLATLTVYLWLRQRSARREALAGILSPATFE